MRVKTVIVDDEKPICDEIEFLLKMHANIEVVAKFTNSLEALDYILKNNPGLVFLDIKMPGLSGFDIAEKLEGMLYPPLIIFLTAFEEHAIKAFDTLAVGYIPKPITPEKITRVLSKVKNIIVSIDARVSTRSDKICVFDNNKIIPLDKKDIVLVYVKEKEVHVCTKNSDFITSLTMQEIEEMIADVNFIRVHRQFLVNINKIIEVIPWFHGSYLLRMDDFRKQEVPVSRGKIKLLKGILGLK